MPEAVGFVALIWLSWAFYVVGLQRESPFEHLRDVDYGRVLNGVLIGLAFLLLACFGLLLG